MPEFNMLVDNVNINYGEKKMANLFMDGKMNEVEGFTLKKKTKKLIHCLMLNGIKRWWAEQYRF